MRGSDVKTAGFLREAAIFKAAVGVLQTDSRWAKYDGNVPAEPAHVESHFSFSRMLSGLEKCAKEKAILGKGSAGPKRLYSGFALLLSSAWGWFYSYA
jgi:hypothetical protein